MWSTISLQFSLYTPERMWCPERMYQKCFHFHKYALLAFHQLCFTSVEGNVDHCQQLAQIFRYSTPYIFQIRPQLVFLQRINVTVESLSVIEYWYRYLSCHIVLVTVLFIISWPLLANHDPIWQKFIYSTIAYRLRKLTENLE